MEDEFGFDQKLEAGGATTDTSTRAIVPVTSSFPPEWTDEEIEEAEQLAARMETYYQTHGENYSIPGMSVEATAENASSYYHGRDGLLELEINPTRKQESLAHEIGHDVETELIPMKGSNLLVSTFNELFADLNALYFTGIEPDERALERDPRKDTSAYSGLGAALSPEFRDEELELLEAVEEAALEDDWDSAQTHARNLVDVAPTPGKVHDIGQFDPVKRGEIYEGRLIDDEYHHRNNMFFQNMLGDDVTAANAYRMDVWRIADTLANQEYGHISIPVKNAVDHEDSRIGTRLSYLSREHDLDLEEDAEQLLGNVLEAEVSSAKKRTRRYREKLQGINQPSADFVMDELGGVKYGNPYDEKVDFPHNVGGQLAEELYLDGVEPIDILQNPAKYVEKSTNRIRQEIHHHI